MAESVRIELEQGSLRSNRFNDSIVQAQKSEICDKSKVSLPKKRHPACQGGSRASALRKAVDPRGSAKAPEPPRQAAWRIVQIRGRKLEMPNNALTASVLPGMTPRRGKVRDVYDFGDRLLFVATDRISAFDWVLPTGIPDKGRILTQLSKFWFDRLDVSNHLLSMDPTTVPLPTGTDVDALVGRSMVVKKASVFPIECVARGYLVGSGWKEYQHSQTVCSIPLPVGLQQAQRLPEPIFTPATKAETGHDENISFDRMVAVVGESTAQRLRDITLRLYQQAAEYALTKGIIIADTKFEFGALEGAILLVDEVLTPDSSRFWPADRYTVGTSPHSYDKQFVRDWLESTNWDKNSTPPEMPTEIVEKTRSKYIEAFETLAGTPFAWR